MILRIKPDLAGIEVCVFVFAQYPMFEELDDNGNIAEPDNEHRWEIVPLP